MFRFTSVTNSMLEAHSLHICHMFCIPWCVLFFKNCSQVVNNVDELLTIALCEAISILAQSYADCFPSHAQHVWIFAVTFFWCFLQTRLGGSESEPPLVGRCKHQPYVHLQHPFTMHVIHNSIPTLISDDFVMF